MPRNISFFHTKDQLRDKSKTVTRRNGWLFLKAGDTLNACEKCQGLGKGGKIKVITQITIVDVSRVRLDTITADDCKREGFPDMTPAEFVKFYCDNMKVKPSDIVTRIEFTYLDDKGAES